MRTDEACANSTSGANRKPLRSSSHGVSGTSTAASASRSIAWLATRILVGRQHRRRGRSRGPRTESVASTYGMTQPALAHSGDLRLREPRRARADVALHAGDARVWTVLVRRKLRL